MADTAPSIASNQTTAEQDAAMAEKIIQDALLIRRLSDKVYRLMIEELRVRHDRTPYF
jgi:hypothetical protein